MEKIGNTAFKDCIALACVTIGNKVNTIGKQAFYACGSLTNIVIPESVTSIGDEIFRDCYNLINMTIGNNVSAIGKQAFYHCSSLTNVTIPNSVKTIGNEAFSDCYTVTSVTIGNSVNTIGDNAFSNCSNLSEVTCLATAPPTLGKTVFTIVNILKVPQGTISAYENEETDWKSYFTTIMELNE